VACAACVARSPREDCRWTTSPRRIGRGTAGTRTWQQLQRFAVVGVVSTVIHLGLFAGLRSGGAGAQVTNLLALLVATVANTALNRRWTFGVQGGGAGRHQAQGLALFGVTWLLTAAGLGLLHLVVTAPPTAVQTAVVAAATALSTALRFVAMRTWMFRPEPQSWLTVNVPDSSSNTTMPVQSKSSTEPWQTATSP
jgi:putative flippase GtrA